MELYLHFGIYKAGSSYLQYLCANLRETLKKYGICFPQSPYDNAMLQGKISPGNAGDLKACLANQQSDKATALLKKWRESAESSNCRKVLVSSEALVHGLATREGLATLSKAVEQSGFERVLAMGFFRDLVDHAVSTYKHRAKSGKHHNFEYWVSHVYEAPHVLNNLFEIHQEYPIKWHFRKFQTDSAFMREAFFKDWLGLNLSEWPHKPKVNESVTLSEVLIMQEISRYYPNVANYFVDRLKAIPKKHKAKDAQLERYYKKMAYNKLYDFCDQIRFWNQYLPNNERIELDGHAKANIDNSNLQLSIKQVKTLLNLIRYFHSPKGCVVKFRRYVVQWLPKNLIK